MTRFCDQYTYKNGTNQPIPIELTNRFILSPDYDSGGAGLFCTVDDYLKIIAVIANGGTTKDGYKLRTVDEKLFIYGENDRANLYGV